MFGIDDAALAILAAGLASSAGSLYANSRNVKANRFANDVNYAIAEANNAAQIQLANTAHQREVFDLRAAGLNPILSAGGSGAATPSLTSARGTPSQIDNPVNDLASSAQSLGRYLSEQYKNDLDQQKADVRNTQISNQLAERQLDLLDLQTDNDIVEESLRKDALEQSTGMVVRRFNDKDGKPYKAVTYEDPDLLDEASKDVSDSYRAAWRDGTNVNWRNNLRAIGGAVGDATTLLNGAGSLMRATDALRRSRQGSYTTSSRSRYDRNGRLIGTDKFFEHRR